MRGAEGNFVQSRRQGALLLVFLLLSLFSSVVQVALLVMLNWTASVREGEGNELSKIAHLQKQQSLGRTF